MPLSHKRPPYLPHMSSTEVLRMGLAPLSVERWIQADTDFPQQLEHKLRMRRALNNAVYQAMDGSEAAQYELAGALKRHLLHHHSALYTDTEQGLVYRPNGQLLHQPAAASLWDCSLWIADDLLIMQKSAGEYRLTAASLCSPSHWLLEDKIGCSITDIHAPVPGLQAHIGASVARFFEHLKPSLPVERCNWSLQADDALCQRGAQPLSVPASAELFYRTERQALLRLPQTQAIVFSIRVYLHPLTTLQEVTGGLQQLLHAVDATPPALANYKGFPAYRVALQKYRAAAQYRR